MAAERRDVDRYLACYGYLRRFLWMLGPLVGIVTLTSGGLRNAILAVPRHPLCGGRLDRGRALAHQLVGYRNPITTS